MLRPETADEYATAFEAGEEDIDGAPLSDDLAGEAAGPHRPIRFSSCGLKSLS